MRPQRWLLCGVLVLALLVSACGEGTPKPRRPHAAQPATTSAGPSVDAPALGAGGSRPRARVAYRVPALLDPHNVYAADGPGQLAPVARQFRALVYVPNSGNDTVTEIDQRTYRVIRQFPVGGLPQHVVPSYDLRTLWVTNDLGNSLTPINPVTGSPGPPVDVADPYNMYYSPDGRYAIVMAEQLRRID